MDKTLVNQGFYRSNTETKQLAHVPAYSAYFGHIFGHKAIAGFRQYLGNQSCQPDHLTDEQLLHSVGRSFVITTKVFTTIQTVIRLLVRRPLR